MDMDVKDRFAWAVRPKAIEQNIYIGKNYRFTVLTSRLIRLEFDVSGKFEDRASQMAFYRDFSICEFQVSKYEGWIKLETEHLILNYKEDSVFSHDSLNIKLKTEPASTWCYGDYFEELGGTTKTLDMIDGACALEQGVCSRNGFSVLDDSNNLVLDENGWIDVREPNTVDCYFFGYGFDYIAAVQDFYRLTGNPPMLPAYALGNWWSRYYSYTQEEYLNLMDRFKEEDIPFTVGVIDMDWHVTQIPEELKVEDEEFHRAYPGFKGGWTGYSWNKELFPDYKAFLKGLKERNLKTSLNLHPHAGLCKHEDMYEEMAKACGIDPTSGKRIPFDVLSPSYMEKYFDIMHHPYEEDGVDFWWMDWQQGTSYWWIHEPNTDGKMHDKREKVDPLWMLNHLHILDISRSGKRPMFFSRYSGPGSHRYPVGFSGDTFVTWESLDFQPYFTATASNIGYCWWSHDIGGHQRGWRDDEMFVRWVQLGVFSPINRLHSVRGYFQRKEPWTYGAEAEMIVKDYLRLRHKLFPYIYTMNYRTHKELLPLVQPMYYSHPKCSGAYEVPNQYWFGSELIVAPITEKRTVSSGHASTTAWLPTGDWFDFNRGLRYASKHGRKMKIYRTLEEEAVFAKAGAIVPMQQHCEHDNHLGGSENMQIFVFPGANNSFALYEDSGDNSDFEQGAFVTTQMELQWGNEARFKIQPARGDLSLIPSSRKWQIMLRGFAKDISTMVFINNKVMDVVARYDVDTNTTILDFQAQITDEIDVQIHGARLLHDNSDVLKRCEKALVFSQINTFEKGHILRSISNENKQLSEKMFDITGRFSDTQPIVGIIRELLSLTEDEYAGSQMCNK